MSYVIVGEEGGGGAPMVRMEHQAVSFTADSKVKQERTSLCGPSA